MQDALHQTLDKILCQVFTNMFQLLQERIKVGPIHVQSDKKMFNYQVSPLDIPPIPEVVERLSSLLDTGGGCHALETVKIKGDTDIAFFKPLDCEPMV